MDAQDKEILKLYLQYRRKRRFLIIILIVVSLFLISGILIYKKNRISNININFDNQSNNINTDTTIEIMGNLIEGSEEIIQENKETEELQKVEKQNKTKQIVKESPIINTDNIKKAKVKSDKPKSKDFLFEDGYTMENVVGIAKEYLKSSNHSGKCIVLKDEDGVCIGMRVIFE